MSEWQFHPNDNAREAKANLWIFEGKSLYFLIAGIALAVLLYRFAFERLQWGNASVAIAVVPLLLITAYVVLLKIGKPKSYDMDFFRSWGLRTLASLHRSGLLRSTLDFYTVGSQKHTRHPYSIL